MSFRHPIQRVCCVISKTDTPALLFTAAGPYILSFDLGSGKYISKWPPGDAADEESTNGNDDQPPTKKQKIRDDGEDEDSRRGSEESIEIIAERTKGKRRKKKLVDNTTLPNVSHILSTSEGLHLTAVTTDDKCIRVFSIQKSGRLKLLSERCMPKRVCAIAMTPDEQKILVGDKFGDVYCLPLVSAPAIADDYPKASVEDPSPLLEPSATELTVHTKRNRDALRQQQLQRNVSRKKEGPNFEHKLLLGHVSLLTDVTIGEIVAENERRREYIFTSDRDEHIRVSRGPSQAHIVENYCLGHKDFVSKLYILPWAPDILVAGSGEPSVKTFRWRTGELIGDFLFSGTAKVDLELALKNGERSLDNLAVSGLWPISFHCDQHEPATAPMQGLVVVAVEGMPVLLSYQAASDGSLKHHQSLPFAGNVLDLATSSELQTIIVSIDNVHHSGSFKAHEGGEVDGHASPLLQSYGWDGLSGRWTGPLESARLNEELDAVLMSDERGALKLEMSDLTEQVSPQKPKHKPSQRAGETYTKLGTFLYGLENLRKKRGQDVAEEDEDEREAEAEAEAEPRDGGKTAEGET